jgi:hypothetical protein
MFLPLAFLFTELLEWLRLEEGGKFVSFWANFAFFSWGSSFISDANLIAQLNCQSHKITIQKHLGEAGIGKSKSAKLNFQAGLLKSACTRV